MLIPIFFIIFATDYATTDQINQPNLIYTLKSDGCVRYGIAANGVVGSHATFLEESSEV